MSIESAIKKFEENFAKFNQRPIADHERYNLYAGLSEMAAAIKRIESEIAAIKKLVGHIDREVR